MRVVFASVFLLVMGCAPVRALEPRLPAEFERPVIDDAIRQHAGGTYAKLSAGVTRYELAGPEAGPRVVLIHGASGPMDVWDRTVAALAGAGYRVLRYDLFGRGFSDRPRARYDEAFYQTQLAELLERVGWNGPLRVVGSSMGAIIGARFVAEHADRVRAVCLIGPAGFPIHATPISKLMPVPLIGDAAMRLLGDRMLTAHNRAYYFQPERFPEAHAKFHEQLLYRGYRDAVLSTMRHMPMNDFSDGYRALGRTAVPRLLLWGREDHTFPHSNLPYARELLGGCPAVTIEQAGHVPQYEQPEQLQAALLPFLASQ